jgi:hypothetical protein
MEILQTRLEIFKKYALQLDDLHLSLTAVDSLKKIVKDLQTYLRNFGQNYKERIKELDWGVDPLRMHKKYLTELGFGSNCSFRFKRSKQILSFTIKNMIKDLEEHINGTAYPRLEVDIDNNWKII